MVIAPIAGVAGLSRWLHGLRERQRLPRRAAPGWTRTTAWFSRSHPKDPFVPPSPAFYEQAEYRDSASGRPPTSPRCTRFFRILGGSLDRFRDLANRMRMTRARVLHELPRMRRGKPPSTSSSPEKSRGDATGIFRCSTAHDSSRARQLTGCVPLLATRILGGHSQPAIRTRAWRTETLPKARGARSCAAMSKVWSGQKKQKVPPPGRLECSLRRIEQVTEIRRETPRPAVAPGVSPTPKGKKRSSRGRRPPALGTSSSPGVPRVRARPSAPGGVSAANVNAIRPPPVQWPELGCPLRASRHILARALVPTNTEIPHPTLARRLDYLCLRSATLQS